MKMWLTIMVGILAASVSAWLIPASVLTHATSQSHPLDHFPVLSRFELPRDYGYFIGDAIPLTLVLETTRDVVLDLVNLPQPGDKHGLFEIRDLSITTTSTSTDHRVYRAAYTLQYFGVTPLRAAFESLKILYALPEDHQGPSHPYTYRSLFTQPLIISLSRIGPFQNTSAIDLKGPLNDRRTVPIWTSFIGGILGVLIVVGGWLWEWRRRRLRHRLQRQDPPSIVDITLTTLRQEGTVLRPADASPIPVASRLSAIVRDYLHVACALPTSTCTTRELASHLHHPLAQELLDILARCDMLKYQPREASLAAEQQLWWETLTVFEKLQKVDTS